MRPACSFLFALACFGASACSPSSPAFTRHSVLNANSNLPSWFLGVWTREWIDRTATRSDLFDIRFVQTPALFGDMRIPRSRPAFTRASSFADLTDADLLTLAKQNGFSGTTSVAGDLATWHHEIDFQPPDSSPDIGRLERIDDSHMYEHATDSSYIESWRSLDSGGGKFVALRIEHSGRLERVLLLAGDHFIYVRNRSIDLPSAQSLDSLIIGTRASRAQVVAYLDCEFSSGRIRSGAMPWEIQRSTLPWREGKHFDFADTLMVDDAGTIVPRGFAREQWSMPVNTLTHAERIALFPPGR